MYIVSVCVWVGGDSHLIHYQHAAPTCVMHGSQYAHHTLASEVRNETIQLEGEDKVAMLIQEPGGEF